MEDDKRRFQPAHISMASVESGDERYAKDGHLSTPPFSAWRNNLTALSCRYNLYFVATTQHVAVFVPDFPYQKLRRTAPLVIDTTLANPQAQGYINPACPHAINHIIVGDLGSEEILLIARDSGNVDAYHTKSIREAIVKDSYRFSQNRRSDYVGLRAFFSQWVHESAWGLAIHKEARMIAVSANTPFHVESNDDSAKVTVFAFALTDGDAQEGEGKNDDEVSNSGESEWQDWSPPTTKGDTNSLVVPERNRNYKIVLGNEHSRNIPSISFANTRRDKEGTWLFSTDLAGDTVAWNIWSDEVVNSWKMYRQEDAPRRRGHRLGTDIYRGVARRTEADTDRGWLVAALDPMAFRVANTLEEYCGLPLPAEYHDKRDSICITNIAGSHVPGNSQVHPRYQNFEDSDDSDDDDGLSDDSESHASVNEVNRDENEDQIRDSASSTDDHLETPAVPISSQTMASTRPVPTLPAEATDASIDENEELQASTRSEYTYQIIATDGGDEDGSTSNDHEQDQDEDQDRSSAGVGSNSSHSSFNPPYASETVADFRRLVLSAEEGEKVDVDGAGIMLTGTIKRSLSEISDDRTKTFPQIPLLHCSVSHLRLFNAPLAKRAHWFCGDLLTQMVPDEFRHAALYQIERINMMQEIPELGIVIIASQVGRCAVCSMVRKGRDGPFGLRVDWILPTRKQEQAGLRPLTPLLGIAVGPIQGMMIQPDNSPPQHDGYGGIRDDHNWEDGVIDETPTSFDPKIVALDAPSDDDFAPTLEESLRGPKRQRLPEVALDAPGDDDLEYAVLPGRRTRFDQRPWQKLEHPEAFRGHSGSRRYRLMLTYYDWTVLTYEISRQAPGIGIDPKRKNYRNRADVGGEHHGI